MNVIKFSFLKMAATNGKKEVEEGTGKPVITSKNSIDFSKVISATIEKEDDNTEA